MSNLVQVLCIPLTRNPDAWHMIRTTDPLVDSDDELGDDDTRLDYSMSIFGLTYLELKILFSATDEHPLSHTRKVANTGARVSSSRFLKQKHNFIFRDFSSMPPLSVGVLILYSNQP